MRSHLTDVSVRALKNKDAQYRVWDTSTRGFGVLVGNTKSWIVMHGRERRLKVIARVSDMSLSEARAAAKKLLVNGLPTVSLSYREAVDLFLEEKRKSQRSRTVKDYKRLLGRLSIKALDTTPHEAAQALANFKSEGEYNHLLVAIKVFFNWCIKRHYIERNPFAGLPIQESSSSVGLPSWQATRSPMRPADLPIR